MTTPPSEQDTERTETRQRYYFVSDVRGYNPGAFSFEEACRIAREDSIQGQCAAFVNADFVVVPAVIWFAGVEFRAVGEGE